MTALAHQLARLIGPLHGSFSASRGAIAGAAPEFCLLAREPRCDGRAGSFQVPRLIERPFRLVNASAIRAVLRVCGAFLWQVRPLIAGRLHPSAPVQAATPRCADHGEWYGDAIIEAGRGLGTRRGLSYLTGRLDGTLGAAHQSLYSEGRLNDAIYTRSTYFRRCQLTGTE